MKAYGQPMRWHCAGCGKRHETVRAPKRRARAAGKVDPREAEREAWIDDLYVYDGVAQAVEDARARGVLP